SSNPHNKEGDSTFDGKEHDAEKPESIVNLSPSSSAQSRRQDDMTKKKDKGKSPIEYFTGNRDFNADFEDCSEDSSNNVSATGPIVPNAGQNYSNSTNPISVAGLNFPHMAKILPVGIHLRQDLVKQSNDVTRLQALVDKKKVVVTEATNRDALHLDDAEGIDCLPNEEIFTALARMGYEKPSTKLTFYRAFFSS
nr:hypothetical protein [Tanacetum cinerariifolium]